MAELEPKKILIVSANPSDEEARILQNAGYEVEVIGSVAEIVQRITSGEHAVIAPELLAASKTPSMSTHGHSHNHSLQGTRETGIDLIGAVPWGTHFCQFYQTKQDLIDILVPYFKAGLENNEFCMWIASEPLDADEAKAALKKSLPDIDRYIESQQIEILPYTDWYVVDGGFDQDRVLQGWVDKLNAALDRGHDGLRLSGNTFWLEKSGWRDFTDYEAAVNDVIGNYRLLAICTYSLDKCGASEIADVVSNHEFALMKRAGEWAVIEMSEFKQAKQALVASEERYRTLFSSMTEGFALHEVICDEHGKPCDYRFLEVNPAFGHLTGLNPDRVTGKTVMEVLPDTEPYWVEKYGRVAMTGEPVHFDNYSGALGRHYEVVAFSPYEGQFATLFVDVTDRKLAEKTLQNTVVELESHRQDLSIANEKLASTNEELTVVNEELEATNEELTVSGEELRQEIELRRHAEESMRSLALFPDENPSPVLRISSDGTILYANKASASLLNDWRCEAGEKAPAHLCGWVQEALDSISSKVIDIECEGRTLSFIFAPIVDRGYVNLYGRDVTESKRAEQEREVTVEFLHLVNCSTETRELINAAAAFFQKQSGCESIGVRLQDGDDYPYIEVQGFTDDFVQAESSLCSRDSSDCIVRDSDGRSVVECMCGNVIRGRFDASQPCFTARGSFWTNSLTSLLSCGKLDPSCHSRNRCSGEGYESVALLPLHVGEERLGLLQLNDRREGVFSPEVISLWEGLADQLAVALAKCRVEEELRDSQADLKRAQAVGQIGSWRLDIARNELVWSDQAYRIFGVPRGTPLTYEAFVSIVHPEDQDYVDQKWQGALRGEMYDIEHRIIANNAVKWVRERAELELDEKGSLLGGFGTTQDITERKYAEQAVAEARAEAERRAAEMEAFISSMADGVALFDATGKPLMANEAAREILGAPLGLPFNEWSVNYELLTPDGEPLPEDQRAIRRALAGDMLNDVHYKLVTPWKETIVSVSGAPVRDADGQIAGAVVVFRDVTDQVEFERQREEVYRREHRIADVLQKALIPDTTCDIPGCDTALRYEPALKEAEVGGDFYDIFDLGEGRTGVLIGDVTGKGLPAAIRVAAARHAIRSYAYLDPRPSRVMTLANDALSRDEIGDTSMLTAFFAVVDTKLGAITYANGGHETPIVRRADGSIEELAIPGRALGALGGYIYPEDSRLLRPGDTIVMITDGITEARPSALELFGIERVKDYLQQNGRVAPETIASGLLDAAKKHAGGKLSDDAAIVVMQLKKVSCENSC